MDTTKILLPALIVLLAGCDQAATVTPGIQAELAVTNAKTEKNATETGEPNEEGYQVFYTAEDKRVDLGQGLLNLMPVQLTECTTAAGILRWLGDTVMPSAYAHTTHTAAPAGIVDVASTDGTEWDLGEIAVPPGTYCGAELALGILPEGSNGAGTPLYVAPCFYPDSGLSASFPPDERPPLSPDEINHKCYDDVPVAGDIQTLAFDLPEPVTLDAAKRFASLRLRIEYDTWFDGFDAAQMQALGCPLTCSPAEAECTACTDAEKAAKAAAQEKLFANVRNSIHVQAGAE
jgi:hypothetical protein